MYACVRAYVYIYVCMYVRTHIRMCVCVCVCVCVCGWYLVGTSYSLFVKHFLFGAYMYSCLVYLVADVLIGTAVKFQLLLISTRH